MVCPNLNNYNTIQILMALFKKKEINNLFSKDALKLKKKKSAKKVSQYKKVSDSEYLSSTPVFNIDNNMKCFLSTRSVY